MIICVPDESGEWHLVEVTPKKLTIPIYYPKSQFFINAEWYTFKAYDGDDISDVKPFFYFYNGALSVFCNNISDICYEKLGRYSRMLFDGYLVSMAKMHYKGDFDQYYISKTTDTEDDDTTYIHWKLGKKFSYKWSDGGKHLTFTVPGDESRCKVFVRWLKTIMDVRFDSWIRMAARKMKLLDKIQEYKISDCTSIKYLNDEGTEYIEFCRIGVDGTNYHQNELSSYETDDYEDDKKSIVKYTPFVYLMDAKSQKILLIHELVHTKIGYLHKHDKYFWYLFEYYSGYKRTDDSSYVAEDEAKDTINHDKKTTGLSCNQLIRKHQQWVDDGEKGQW